MAEPNGLEREVVTAGASLGEATGEGRVDPLPVRGNNSSFRRLNWGVGGIEFDAANVEIRHYAHKAWTDSAREVLLGVVLARPLLQSLGSWAA